MNTYDIYEVFIESKAMDIDQLEKSAANAKNIRSYIHIEVCFYKFISIYTKEKEIL